MVDKFEDRLKKRNTERRWLELDRNRFEAKLNQYITKYMWVKLNEKEQAIYEKEVNKYTSLINNIQADIDVLKNNERNDILEYQALFGVIQNASKEFVWLNYVQKRKIVSLLLLNITINDDSSVDIYYKPWLEELLPYWGGWRGSNPRQTESQSATLPAELQPPYKNT